MLKFLLAVFFILCTALSLSAQKIYESEKYQFGVSGYLRTGFGLSQGGETQADFQMADVLNKFSFGNQADTYGELEFNSKIFLDSDKSKTLDLVWMTSFYEPFGSEGKMSFDFTEQLYFKLNNLFGGDESIWVGKRFYDRKALYMLDRHWLNPGQKGWGFGVENLLKRTTSEDLKFAAWQFSDKDVTSFSNQRVGNLYNYTFDARWVNIPFAEFFTLNFAANYSVRTQNKELGYDTEHGYGLFSWLHFVNGNIKNTSALIFRQGANIPVNHWSGISMRENPYGDNWVTRNLSGSYLFEVNNKFLYDDLKNFSLNGTLLFAMQNYGTVPYQYTQNGAIYDSGKGKNIFWVAAGARGLYYVSDFFRPAIEYSHEYVVNNQKDVRGHLNRVTISPEFSLSKGYYSRPVLRPFVSYAFWSDDLKGTIGTTPTGAPYGDKTSGFNVGMQFEIWW